MGPSYEITPEPTEEERAAIAAALASEEAECRRATPWADALLPRRDGEENGP